MAEMADCLCVSAVRVANAKALIDKTEMAMAVWHMAVMQWYMRYMHMPLPLLPLEMAGQQNHQPPGTK